MSCVIVLGLPRGGTSATAGLIHHLGVPMGQHLLPPMRENPKGFFEDMDFLSLHDQLLGNHHYDPEERFLLPDSDPLWIEYSNLLARKDRQEIWGVKDPKMCFLLPKFLERVSSPVKIVLVRRLFHDTVHSYEKLWNGMPRGEAIRRLGHYQYALSKNLAGITGKIPVHQVSYEIMCEYPETVARGIAEFLGVEYREEAARFIDPALNRNGNIRRSKSTVSTE